MNGDILKKVLRKQVFFPKPDKISTFENETHLFEY